MLTSLMTILGAILTILGPFLAAGVVAWADRKHEESLHATMDETDAYIRQVLGNNPVGRANLSRTLERLQREAQRKHRYPGSP